MYARTNGAANREHKPHNVTNSYAWVMKTNPLSMNEAIASYNDTYQAVKLKRQHRKSFARVGWPTYLIPEEYVLHEVVISPTFDFRIFLDAKLWKMIPKIWFSICFSPPKKIDRNMAVFPKKSENYTNAIISSIFSGDQK